MKIDGDERSLFIAGSNVVDNRLHHVAWTSPCGIGGYALRDSAEDTRGR